MDEKQLQDILTLKHKVENTEKSQESILKNLSAIDAKLTSIAEKLNKFDVLQSHLTYLEKRVESLEKLRWWGGTLLLGALFLAMVKSLLK